MNYAALGPPADSPRFAFVEYESRRDADDAYHEMHNKRIGRDDLLKIEVRAHQMRHSEALLTGNSGPVLRLRLPGDLTPAATVLAAASAPPVVGACLHAVAEATTHRAKMTAVIVTMIDAIATELGAPRETVIVK